MNIQATKDTIAAALVRGFDIQSARQRVEHTLAGLQRDAEDARELGDDALVKLTRDRVAAAKALTATAERALVELEREEGIARDLAAKLLEAEQAMSEPDGDPAAQLQRHAIAKLSWEQRLPILARLRSAVSSPMHRVAQMPTDADGRAREEARKSTATLAACAMNPAQGHGLAARAERDGAMATPATAGWWPFFEAKELEDAKPLLEGARAKYERTGGWVATWSRSDDGYRQAPPTIADVQAAFEMRREAYAAGPARYAASVAQTERTPQMVKR